MNPQNLILPLLLLLPSSILCGSSWSNKPEQQTCASLFQTRKHSAKPPIQQFVMGPLERVLDWDAFSRKLEALQAMGVYAITTDIYWGWVEPEAGRFNWDYYHEYFRRVTRAGLKWVPIFSFHKIGGNVGDNVEIPIPQHVWQRATDMRFRNRHGFESDEHVHFLVPEAYDWYEAVMESFRSTFWDKRESIAKIYVGAGPAGEARYPSYAFAAGWKYPEPGEIQAFGPRAQRSLREFLKVRYQNIEKLNTAWELSFTSFDDPRLGPPTDGEQYLRQGRKMVYGTDIQDWYQFVLENHVFELLHRARRVFLPFAPLTEVDKFQLEHQQSHSLKLFYGSQALSASHRPHFPPYREAEMAGLYWKHRSLNWRLNNPINQQEDFLGDQGSLGLKIAGIHWLHNHPEYPRAAAELAGYTTYQSPLALAAVLGATVTFTCMEMQDGETQGAFSMPRSLIDEVAETSAFMGIPLFGENALAIGGDKGRFENLRRVFGELDIHGFTFLRMHDLVDEGGTPTENAPWYTEQISQRLKTRFGVDTLVPAEVLAKNRYEVRLGHNEPKGDGDPFGNSVAMMPLTSHTWSVDLQVNDPARLSWKFWIVHKDTGEIAYASGWIPSDYLSGYYLKSETFEGFVIHLYDPMN